MKLHTVLNAANILYDLASSKEGFAGNTMALFYSRTFFKDAEEWLKQNPSLFSDLKEAMQQEITLHLNAISARMHVETFLTSPIETIHADILNKTIFQKKYFL